MPVFKIAQGRRTLQMEFVRHGLKKPVSVAILI
jgi:hypothetical protein